VEGRAGRIRTGRPQGQEQPGHATLAGRETQRGQLLGIGDRAVAAGGDDCVGDAGPAAQHLQVGGGQLLGEFEWDIGHGFLHYGRQWFCCGSAVRFIRA